MPDPVDEPAAAPAQPVEEMLVEVVEIGTDGQEHVIEAFAEGPMTPDELAGALHEAETGHADPATPSDATATDGHPGDAFTTADPVATDPGHAPPADDPTASADPTIAAAAAPHTDDGGADGTPTAASAPAEPAMAHDAADAGEHPVEVIEIVEIVEVHDSGSDIPVAHADAPAHDEPASHDEPTGHDAGSEHSGAEDYADAFFHDPGSV